MVSQEVTVWVQLYHLLVVLVVHLTGVAVPKVDIPQVRHLLQVLTLLLMVPVVVERHKETPQPVLWVELVLLALL
jgi:hypothetical protein